MNQAEVQKVRFWPIMVAIFIGSFLCVLASATINLALEILTDHFNTTLGSVQWTLTGFMLAMGTTAPVAGYLGERFSYRRLYLFSLIGFTLASILCATAWSEGSLILFRVLQGAFSGLIIPATMSIIYQIIPRERQAMAVAFWGLSAMLAPAFGPTISGWILENMNWQWLFLMNIPIGLIAIGFVYAYIPYYRMNIPKSFDGLGFLTVIISSSSLLLALGQGHNWGWGSWKIVSLFVIGVIALLLFIWRELTTETPLLNLKVFKNKRFTLNAVISNIITISLYSGTLLTPVFLQRIQHVSAMDTGMVLLPASLAMALLMPVVGKLYGIIGPRWLMSGGIVLLTIGTLALSWLSVDVSHSYVIWWMIVRNIGIAFVVMPSSNAAMEQIPAELSGHASAITNWTRNVFGSFAIAIFTTMLASRSITHATDLMKAGDTNELHIGIMSFTMSVNDVYVVATLVAVVALPLSLFIGKTKREEESHPKSGKEKTAVKPVTATVSGK
ncbi:DHA2 family efflux MFS transporter permease subunit [Paenibacillus sp. LHD-38]|uniref:DHA2 family efflux MFS transporter permease subunit n=1 Tax=Paenibacillus sp. LHD-38 TaxID=3072143 RepID=UPI00280FAD93|nr:DHA2 family efflux MFS transporter permease subunit [Paenibacillus sp. LHD-38]MDQ8738972.1 DHA2 family efflux MFS transporter permease subunit [Paenibacillus sp. LHD-38]